jgi:hypothetical protein
MDILYIKVSPQFHGIQLVVIVLSHGCNSHTDSGEVKVECCASSETRPSQAALLLDNARLTRKPTAPSVRRNTVHLATVSVCMHLAHHRSR